MNVELDFVTDSKEVSVRDLKNKVKSELTIEQTSLINLLEKRTLKELQDDTVLIFNDGKLFSKDVSSSESKERQLTRRNLHSQHSTSNSDMRNSKNDSTLSKEEIELIISYRCICDDSSQ